MADTQRLKSALIALLADNSTGEISEQDIRDMLVSIMGSQTITTVSGATHTLSDDDQILHVTRTLSGICTITLPTSLTIANKVITIVDAGFNAQSYNITIETEGFQKINNSAGAYTLSRNGEYVRLYCDGSNWYIASRTAFDSAEVLRLNSASSTEQIMCNTENGADVKALGIVAGGSVSQERGAGIVLYGNEFPSSAKGIVELFSGNIADAVVNFYCSFVSGPDMVLNRAGNFGIGVTARTGVKLDVDGVVATKAYTVGTLPSVVVSGLIYISNETGGATLAFSDGTNWRRCWDLAIVS